MSMDLDEQYDKIYRYCYFKVQHREIAEDITQETFLRFLESKHYQNRGQALQYLYRIAGNLCIDEYRRGQRKPLPLDAFAEEPASSPTDTEDGILNQIFVRSALAKLSPEERELLLLRYANEVPVSVIAKLLGISRFAVYRRILSASAHLKENLGKEDSNE